MLVFLGVGVLPTTADIAVAATVGRRSARPRCRSKTGGHSADRTRKEDESRSPSLSLATRLAVSRETARWDALACVLAEGVIVVAQGGVAGLCSRRSGGGTAVETWCTTDDINFTTVERWLDRCRY